MKKGFTLLFLVFFLAFNAQKKKNVFDISSNIEARVLAVKALGNNTLSKDFGVFYGFGFGGQLVTPVNFGIGLDYNLLFGDLKPGRQNYFGNLGSQRLTDIDIYIIHKDEISEDFSVEESAGFSIYRLNSTLFPGKEKYTEGKGGFNVGLKGVYSLDRDGIQQFVFGIKGNAYFSGTNNENPDIEKYYNRSFLIGVTFGYRYNF